MATPFSTRRRRRLGSISPTARPGSFSLEGLETRRLLSTVNVTDFGARPGDGGDDSGAIQAAINASAPGDTVYFADGAYSIGSTIRLAGNRTYAGRAQDGAAVLRSIDRGTQVMDLHSDNTTIKWLTIDGKGLFMDKSGGPIANLTIDNCIFNVRASGEHPNGIEWTSGLRDSRITNNLFHPMEGEGADHSMVGYGWQNLRIANNEVTGFEGRNATHGFHVLGFSDSRDLLIEQNYFANIRRMTVEYQGGGWNTIVQDNYYENPALSADFSANDSSLGFSLPSDQSHGLIARRNTLMVPERPDGVGVRMGFEVAGHDFHVYDNYIKGVNHTVAVTNSGANGEIVNNKFDGFIQAAGPNNGGLVNIANNGAGVNLTWDINRGRPGRNHTFGGAPIIVQAPAPVPNPTPGPISVARPTPPAAAAPVAVVSRPTTAPDAPTDIVASPTGVTWLDVTWTASTNATGYKVEMSTDGQTWAPAANVGIGQTRCRVSGLTSEQTYMFRVQAINEVGASAFSDTAQATTLKGTISWSDWIQTHKKPWSEG